MPKDATVGARVDAELKEKAGEVFDQMGLPMSLGIELFLRQVADKGKLPFALSGQDDPDPERQTRERDFWRAYLMWNFDAWPRFDSESAERKAREKYGYDSAAPGRSIMRLISNLQETQSAATNEKAKSESAPVDADLLRAAIHEAYQLQCLLGDAKELIYWALGMEKAFVPSLAAAYNPEGDTWRLEHLRSKAKERQDLVADELDDDELMDLFGDWIMESGLDQKTESLLLAAAENATDFEDIRKLLSAADALEDFEDYVEDVTSSED